MRLRGSRVLANDQSDYSKLSEFAALEFQRSNYLEYEKSKERNLKFVGWKTISSLVDVYVYGERTAMEIARWLIALGLTSLERRMFWSFWMADIDFFWWKDFFTSIISDHRTRWFRSWGGRGSCWWSVFLPMYRRRKRRRHVLELKVGLSQ